MSAATPSRERTLGRTLLASPLMAEALEAFAATEDRTVPHAAEFLLHRVLLEWGWLAFASGDYVAGTKLLAYRQRETPDVATLAAVVPLARPSRSGGAR